MTEGIVFDIKEFAVFDGPGVRTTVFMKGCPLRCQWCHNPEGLSPKPQLTVSPSRCLHCGKCAAHCPTPDSCTACGACIPYCPLGLRRIAGQPYTPDALAERLLKDRDILEGCGGGVTFSGGEPMLQWPFVREVISRLDGLHTAIETNGYCSDEAFGEAMSRLDLIMMDIKLTDPEKHRHFTGVDNSVILRHADALCAGDTPFIIRMPLIPGVNDGEAHFAAVARRLKGAKRLIRVEFLPYHKTAGAKYPLSGMTYAPEFDESAPVRLFPEPFRALGIPVMTM